MTKGYVVQAGLKVLGSEKEVVIGFYNVAMIDPRHAEDAVTAVISHMKGLKDDGVNARVVAEISEQEVRELNLALDQIRQRA